MATKTRIMAEVNPFQVIRQMNLYDWSVALGVFREVLGPRELESYLAMLQQVIATAQDQLNIQ